MALLAAVLRIPRAATRRHRRRAGGSTLELGAKVATISFSLNYLAPAYGELVCKGAVVKGGRSIAFAEAEVTDERGTAVCRATATYRLLPKL